MCFPFQIEESKLTAQVACLQNLDSGSPAAAEGGKSFLHLSLSLYSRLFALITLGLLLPRGLLRPSGTFPCSCLCSHSLCLALFSYFVHMRTSFYVLTCISLSVVFGSRGLASLFHYFFPAVFTARLLSVSLSLRPSL